MNGSPEGTLPIASGPAPEPPLHMALGDGSPELAREAITITPEQIAQQNAAQIELPNGFTYTPPPPDPGLASQLSEARSAVGELMRAIGEQRKQYELQLEEMNLQISSLMALSAGIGQRPPQFAPPQFQHQAPPQAPPSVYADDAPAGAHPQQGVTVEQLSNAMLALQQNLQTGIDARLALGAAGVTAAEYQKAVAQYPHVTNLPEPARTQFVINAVNLARRRDAAAQPPQAPGAPAATVPVYRPQAPPQNAHVPPTRPYVVPMPEQPTPTGSFEPAPPADAVAAANAKFEAAKRDPRLTNEQRLAVMKQAMLEAVRAKGLSETDFLSLGWTQAG